MIKIFFAASLFFITYETLKIMFQPQIPEQYHVFIHMTAASVGEMVIYILLMLYVNNNNNNNQYIQFKGVWVLGISGSDQVRLTISNTCTPLL